MGSSVTHVQKVGMVWQPQPSGWHTVWDTTRTRTTLQRWKTTCMHRALLLYSAGEGASLPLLAPYHLAAARHFAPGHSVQASATASVLMIALCMYVCSAVFRPRFTGSGTALSAMSAPSVFCAQSHTQALYPEPRKRCSRASSREADGRGVRRWHLVVQGTIIPCVGDTARMWQARSHIREGWRNTKCAGWGLCSAKQTSQSLDMWVRVTSCRSSAPIKLSTAWSLSCPEMHAGPRTAQACFPDRGRV